MRTRTSATGSADPARAIGGFTLIELLVVLAIMVGLTAAFPIARDRLDPERAVSLYAARLTDDLRELRSIAMQRNATAALVIDPTTPGYRLPALGLARALPAGWTLDAAGALRILASADRPPDQASDQPPQPEIDFYPDGSSSGAEILLSRPGYDAHVRVSALTGRVSVE